MPKQHFSQEKVRGIRNNLYFCGDKQLKECKMTVILNNYHRKVNAMKQKSVAYWRTLPMSHEECLNQFRRLRAQRIARESRLQN